MKIRRFCTYDQQMAQLGRHRIMKAILTGKKTIKAVRFDENPSPCQIDDKE